MKNIDKSSIVISIIIYAVFSLISFKQFFSLGAEAQILNVNGLMLLPFTCGIAISFQIFLNIFSNENKTTKLLSGFFVIFFLIICFALIAKFWETPLSMLIAFALLEPLKNKLLLKSYDGDVLTWVLFAASFLILFLSHVIAKILKVDLFEKYIFGFLMYGFMAIMNWYMYRNLRNLPSDF
ncbi:hypothetical protein SAMN05421765_2510 [Kaistella antarctica]|uniref:Uncharacterized protein n=2 Tax=Kaistella antarctica TaxID=266748 RepID=A0A448NQW9_9FLAO|nr:hypothetical protein SAMN05421765_2510 [Kaistella antarctica]VEH99109.1 Uncharacterised protein [Kaistella antarctica]